MWTALVGLGAWETSAVGCGVEGLAGKGPRRRAARHGGPELRPCKKNGTEGAGLGFDLREGSLPRVATRTDDHCSPGTWVVRSMVHLVSQTSGMGKKKLSNGSCCVSFFTRGNGNPADLCTGGSRNTALQSARSFRGLGAGRGWGRGGWTGVVETGSFVVLFAGCSMTSSCAGPRNKGWEQTLMLNALHPAKWTYQIQRNLPRAGRPRSGTALARGAASRWPSHPLSRPPPRAQC